MALSVRADGSGPSNLINSGWFNDFYNLFTGAMTDQAVKFNYRPGAGTTPTLTLDGDGHGPLLKGLKTDHSTQAFAIDSSGNLSVAGTGTFTGALTVSGGNPVIYGTAGLTGKMTAQSTAPTSPTTGDLWLDTSTVLG